ncbi:hypothetical protein E4Q08_19625 [Candidatus Accumulibacter phosphatis]|uniref:Uncharacterized protein n=1 Tax=Candidatus Accumulibacter contiguus TaxID=2954381 RepID=A0ABX1TE08_9PROT|nr:hypothetical protein [Candidatus Accumulibacter contiguus]NMQ07289.1 hypothetical protein [Candidatus Accumulibacter contiguus]
MTTPTDSLSTDRFPSSLPTWIKNWARQCRDGEKPENDDFPKLMEDDIGNLWRLLSNPAVALGLEKLDRGKSADDSKYQSRVIELLEETLHFHWVSKRRVVESPSRQREKLTRLAQDVDHIAEMIESFKDFLGPALNIRYLLKRFSMEQATGFVRKRMGLGAPALFPTDGSQVLLTDLLVTFSEDVRDELSFWPRRINGLDGGRDAPVRYQVKRIKKIVQRPLRWRQQRADCKHAQRHKR